MAMLPWDDIFYHVSQKEQRLNDLYNTYQHQRDQISLDGQNYNGKLDQYKTMIVYNSALLIAHNDATMKDSDFATWLKANDLDKPGKPDGDEVAKAFQWVSTTTGTVLVGLAVKNFAKTYALPAIKSIYQSMKNLWGTAVEDVADQVADEGVQTGISAAADAAEEVGVDETVDAIAESIGEGVAETAASSFLEGLGVSSIGNLALAGGIFAAVGIDAILGAIDGAQEARELDNSINNLRSALNKVNSYLTVLKNNEKKVEDGIISCEKMFLQLMNILSKIQKPSFEWRYPVGMENRSNFKAAMYKAQNQYGILSKIRHDWQTMKQNNPSLTWDLFKTVEEMQRPSSITKEQLDELLDFVAAHSDLMTDAKQVTNHANSSITH